MEYREKYNDWLENEYFDEITKEELRAIKDDEKEIEDRFYRDLTFGTAGLRGKIGAGTNRMNKYTVALTTQGLANVILNKGQEAMDMGVAIAYDVRKFSDEFAEIAARVLAGSGIKTYLFDDISTTPILSYTVRRLKTISGIVVTASHNPKDYNGYKLYWKEGSQILDDIGDQVLEEINKLDSFNKVTIADKDEAIENGLIEYIGQDIRDEYISKILDMKIEDDIDKEIKIVYTPLNGTGNIPVRRVLKERGFTNVSVVKEQEKPDPNFTTAKYPNPEDIKAFEYADRLGRMENAEILIATDPDCDRVAMGVKDIKDEGYIYLNGNQIGALLINYILSTRAARNDLPQNGAIVKSIVTGDLGRAIANKYGIKMFEALTGFKNICEYPNIWDKTEEYKFIFGYEESIGYVYNDLVRDKDAVVSSMLIAEMSAYYKKRNKSILEVLEDLYKEFGYYNEKLISVELKGVEGQRRIARIMESIRLDPVINIGDMRLEETIDYQNNTTGLRPSNVLKYYLNDGSWYAIRPSGTEPKIKLYIYSKGKSLEDSQDKVDQIEEKVKARMEKVE